MLVGSDRDRRRLILKRKKEPAHCGMTTMLKLMRHVMLKPKSMLVMLLQMLMRVSEMVDCDAAMMMVIDETRKRRMSAVSEEP